MQNNTFSTLFVGQNLIKLSEVDSTNDFLKSLASNSEPLPEGTVIMAEHQSRGRGQRGNTWKSEIGKNLTFSIYLNPRFLDINNQFYLNIAVSLSLNDTLKNYLGSELRIKWPNDIYYQNKKIGGILIENSIVGSQIKNSIIGIGLNVNQTNFEDSLNQKASSISQILQQSVPLERLLSEICTEFERYYLVLKTNNYNTLKPLYQNQLYLLNIKSRFKDKNGEFYGTIKGINSNGQLQVELENGILNAYSFKEIEYLTYNL